MRIKGLFNVYSRFHETLTTNFPNFTRLLRSSKVHNEIHKPVRIKATHLIGFFTSRTNQGLCLQIGLWIPIWASELRNELANFATKFHSQFAQGPCISLQVVSRHPGIYTIITNQIKCPGVFPGGGDGYSWNWLMHYEETQNIYIYWCK
jgi:hypothetical protein